MHWKQLRCTLAFINCIIFALIWKASVPVRIIYYQFRFISSPKHNWWGETLTICRPIQLYCVDLQFFKKKIIAHFYSSLDIDNTAVHCSITVVCIFHCGTFLFLTRFPHCIIPTAWSCWLSCGVLVYYEILLPVYCTMKLSKPPSVQWHFCFKAFKISLDWVCMASRLSNFIIMMNKEKLNMRKKRGWQ